MRPSILDATRKDRMETRSVTEGRRLVSFPSLAHASGYHPELLRAMQWLSCLNAIESWKETRSLFLNREFVCSVGTTETRPCQQRSGSRDRRSKCLPLTSLATWLGLAHDVRSLPRLRLVLYSRRSAVRNTLVVGSNRHTCQILASLLRAVWTDGIADQVDWHRAELNHGRQRRRLPSLSSGMYP